MEANALLLRFSVGPAGNLQKKMYFLKRENIGQINPQRLCHRNKHTQIYPTFKSKNMCWNTSLIIAILDIFTDTGLFINYASQCQGQGRDKQGQAGTRQGQTGTNRDKAGTNRDKQAQAGTVPSCMCLSLHHFVTRDTWHATWNNWHVTCCGGWTFSQSVSSLALLVCDLWYFED